MGPEVFFPTNPGLADILGDTDFDFENLDFLDPRFPDFQVPYFLISRNLAWARLGPGLGQAWAWAGPGLRSGLGLGLGLGSGWTRAQRAWARAWAPRVAR